MIESEIRRLDEVVQGFLKFSRPEDLRLQPVRVTAIFDEILPVIKPEAAANHAARRGGLPRHVPAVNGDAAMLRQAFLNLAMNACQAMPNGGTLRLSARPRAAQPGEVRFEDTGVGIPAEHLGKIFDLYFTTKDHGTGIGLSMVYRIIQLHDGEVEVAIDARPGDDVPRPSTQSKRDLNDRSLPTGQLPIPSQAARAAQRCSSWDLAFGIWDFRRVSACAKAQAKSVARRPSARRPCTSCARAGAGRGAGD